MATALLITRDDLVRYTAVNGNVDVDKFIQFIKIAQDIHIQNYLGTKLLEKIQAAEKSIQAPIAIPQDVQELALGPDAIMRSANPQGIRRVPLELPANKRLLRISRLSPLSSISISKSSSSTVFISLLFHHLPNF